MSPAVARLAQLARAVSTHDPRIPVISNKDGSVVHDGREVVARIVGQIANPVRWDLCMDTMSDLRVTGILEMPPAGTLTGIAKRNLKGVETFALKTPDQLDAARDFCDKHGEASAFDTSPTWRMVVSPGKGTFHLHPEAADGGRAGPRGRRSATSPAAGTGRRSSPGTAARSPSGSSRTATSCPRASPWSGSTPQEARHDRRDPRDRSQDPSAPRHARILGIGSYRPSRVVPNSEVVEASTPATSGSSSGRASSSAAGLDRTRPCR